MRFADYPVAFMAVFCVGAMLASLLIIHIPIVNFLFMFLLLPLWFGGAILLSMAAIVVLAIKRQISAFWLLLPLLYFGYGYISSQYSHNRAKEIARSIETKNMKVRWQAPRPFEYRAIDTGAVGYSEIVERFRDTKAIFPSESASTIRYFAKGEECEKASKGFYYDRRFEEPWLYRSDIFPTYNKSEKSQQCILSIDVKEVLKPRHSITNERSPEKGDQMNPRLGERFTVRDENSGRTLARIETATIRYFSPILFFSLDCKGGPLSSSVSECGFSRIYASKGIPAGYKPRTDKGNPFIPTGDPMNSRIGALGQAIGLVPRQPND